MKNRISFALALTLVMCGAWGTGCDDDGGSGDQGTGGTGGTVSSVDAASGGNVPGDADVNVPDAQGAVDTNATNDAVTIDVAASDGPAPDGSLAEQPNIQAQFVPGGLDRLFITAAFPQSDACYVLTLVWPELSTQSPLTVPDGWSVESIVSRSGASICDAYNPDAGTPVQQATGSVTYSTSSSVCPDNVDVDVVLDGDVVIRDSAVTVAGCS